MMLNGSPLRQYMSGTDAYSRRLNTELAAAASHGKLMVEDYMDAHKEDLQQRLEEKKKGERDTDEEADGE